MLLEIYTQNDVSPQDERSCLTGTERPDGTIYAYEPPFYIVAKGLHKNDVIFIFEKIINRFPPRNEIKFNIP